MKIRISNTALSLATVFLLACGGGGGGGAGGTTPTATGGDEGSAEGADQDLLGQGASVFGEYCATCHGDAGEGGGAPAVAGANALMEYATDQALFDYVKAEMPQDDPGSLTEAQYRAVVAWMRAQSGR